MNIDKFIKLAEKSFNMERNAKNGYMECFLGIIDILGFSDFVNNNENAVKLITEIISNSFFSNESQLEKISYKMLSDTLIVYTNENTQYALINLIFALENFRIKCLEKGFLSRGAVVQGKFYLDKDYDIMVSPAFIEAYRLEENDACYPRILITNEVYDFLMKNLEFRDDCFFIEKLKFVKDYIENDFDDFYVVRPFRNIDIIAKAIYPNYKDCHGHIFRTNIDNDEKDLNRVLSDIRNWLIDIYKDIELKDASVRRKYNYFAREFNETLEKCSKYIDIENIKVKLFKL
ncbi:MAG: hypothetical protein MST05_11470 [Treponema sp.]|nr:hypothetical protein [Treponema sp.]